MGFIGGLKMKIVVLDGYTENPGDLSWDALGALGDLVVYDRTPEDQVVTRISDAEVVFTNKTVIGKEIIECCPNLKYIGVLATGYNVVDVEAASSKNIIVTNIPSYGTDAVAQYTMALLLEVCHHIGAHSDAVIGGAWSRQPDFCFWNYNLIELKGKTIGLIGFGKIGQAVSKMAQAFGMQVVVNTRGKIKEEFLVGNVREVSLNELLQTSDVISLHCPLLADNKGLIRRETIENMKDGVIILNTARGPLICEQDLKEALESGKVAYAAVDVVSKEPIEYDNPLLTAPNIIITPHIAWAPKEARQRLMDIAVDNLRAFLNGSPQNVVS